MKARQERVPSGALLAGRLALAAVWIYEGLIAKIIGTRPDELEIVASLPLIGDQHARLALILIGAYELALAFGILTRVRPKLVAALQTATLVAFNAGGVLLGGVQISDPVGMVVANTALLALAWIVALGDNDR